MKTVYYVAAPQCSGKTTSARALAARMELPVYHADLVYNMLCAELNLDVPPGRLIDPRKWDDPGAHGLESWGDYPDMDAAKAPLFAKLLEGETGDFVIEGFTLSFASERALVEKVVGPHRAVLLQIDLTYEKWLEFFKSRHGEARKSPHQVVYKRLFSYFEAGPDDIVYTFSDPEKMVVHYALYQKPEFVSKKIEALKIPVQEGDVINDIGCNDGNIGKWCLDHGASHAHGYDANWRFLDKARQNGLEPHLGNVEIDPLETADITLCVSVFHYFRDPQSFLEKAAKATKRLFILEIPIYQKPGYVSMWLPRTRITRYSSELIEHWLNENFAEVKCVGESIPPDNSYRLVYHCYV